MSSLPTQARVIIIGGGISGCSIAYHLAKLGWTDIVLLERKKLTSGTTWHAAGLVGQLRGSQNMTRLAKYSTDLYGRLEAETGLATGFKETGSITVALTEHRKEEILRSASLARVYGVAVEELSPAEVKARYPLLNTEGVVAGVYLPHDGQADPGNVALSLARGARNMGATHDQEEAMTLSDRIAVMANGKVLQVDSPSGLYDAPISRDVASFIGTMNFFPGEVAGMDGDSLIVTTKGLGRVSVPSRGRSYSKGQSLDLAIRPEKLKLSQDAPNDAGLSVAGRLVDMAYLGERSHFHVALDGMEQQVAVSVQNDRALLGGFDPGATVWLRCDPDAIVVLSQA